MNSDFIHVAAAAIVNDKGKVLVSQRKHGAHLGGYWEFPGGKLEPGETVEAALARELKEELDIVPMSSRPLIRTRHHYRDKSVLLDVWKVDAYTGQARGVEGQSLAWRSINELEPTDFPPADVPIINALLLPDRYLITGEFTGVEDFQQRLATALSGGIRLVQLRLTENGSANQAEFGVYEIVECCTDLCRRYSAQLMFNLPQAYHELIRHGIHLNSRQLLACSARPKFKAVSASCHNRRELEHAQSIGADFAVLSPVQPTRSHPGASTLGWQAFGDLVDECDIPVFALGGMTMADMARSWRAGAQGIAAIGAFWDSNQVD